MNVIFDLDGTLANSAIITVAAINSIAPRYMLPVPSTEAIRGAIGYANPEFYDRLFPGCSRKLVRQAGEAIECEELRILPQYANDLLFADCRELLEELRGKGYSLTIASTGSKEHVHAILDESRIRGLFSAVRCGLPEKSGMIRAAIGSASKGDFIMVGDMRKDSDAARFCGIPSVGACYGYCQREVSDFDYYIDTPFELLNILHK